MDDPCCSACQTIGIRCLFPGLFSVVIQETSRVTYVLFYDVGDCHVTTSCDNREENILKLMTGL